MFLGRRAGSKERALNHCSFVSDVLCSRLSRILTGGNEHRCDKKVKVTEFSIWKGIIYQSLQVGERPIQADL